jgi:hypothetical protein
MPEGHRPSSLAHIVEQCRLKHYLILVTRPTQGVKHIQAVALIPALHTPKERRLGRLESSVYQTIFIRAHLSQDSTEKLLDTAHHGDTSPRLQWSWQAAPS